MTDIQPLDFGYGSNGRSVVQRQAMTGMNEQTKLRCQRRTFPDCRKFLLLFRTGKIGIMACVQLNHGRTDFSCGPDLRLIRVDKQ